MENSWFIPALKIKGVLGEQVNTNLLRSAIERGDALRDEVLFYLSKVSVPELETEVIALIQAELGVDNECEVDRVVYWMIRALMGMKTSNAKTYLDELKKHPKVKIDGLLQTAFD